MISTKSALLVASLFLALVSVSCVDKPDLVIEVFRHGARGALYKTYDIDNKWGNNVGELTSGGMRMHYLLGSALKKKYPDLLSKYDPVDIYVRSTDVNRTIMSAYSQLAGVFENMGPSLENDKVVEYALPAYQSSFIQDKVKELNNTYALPNSLQAVPIHVVPKAYDTVLRSYDACNRSKEWAAENSADAVTTSIFNNEMKEVVSYLKSQGISVSNMNQLSVIGDNCVTNRFQGLPLPGGVTPDDKYYKDLKFATEYMTVKQHEGTAMQRALYSTPILNEIKTFIENYRTSAKSSPKFVFLSAHDTTLMTILAAFNITTPECLLENYRSEKAGKELLPYPNCVFPQYASNLIFEYNSKKSNVTFYYNGVSVPFCQKEVNQCNWSEFKTYISNVTNKTTVANYNKICGFEKDAAGTVKKNPSGLSTLETILIPLCSILFMSLLGTCVLFRKKQYARLKRSLSAESLITDI